MSRRRSANKAVNTSQPDDTSQAGSSTNSKSRTPKAIKDPPIRITRFQGNDRLASYINKVKHLETENTKLTQELNSLQETNIREVSNVKLLFESELEDCRNALDREVKLKSQLELKYRRQHLEVKKLNTKLNKATKDLKKATLYKAQFDELNSKYGKTLNDIKILKDTNEKLSKELMIEKNCVEDSLIVLGKESLEKIEIEKQLQSLKEKFNEEVHKQQLNDTVRRTEISKIKGRLIKEYEDKLQAELQLIQQQAEEKIKLNMREISELFDGKMLNLENELQHQKNTVKLEQENVSAANDQISQMLQHLNILSASNNDHLVKIVEQEKLLENQRFKHQSEIKALDHKLTTMQNDYSQKVQEYQNLMDIKNALDIEIRAYRKLLESKERRLSISPNSVVGSSINKKRKLLHRDESENELSNSVTTSSTGDIEISEVCPDGQFITLYNKGPKEVALGGFKLICTAEELNNYTSFKFDSIKMEAGDSLTIWSSTAKNQMLLNPIAGSIFMSSKSWVVGSHMATVLLNTEGQKIATHELKKERASHSQVKVEEFDEHEKELFYQPNGY